MNLKAVSGGVAVFLTVVSVCLYLQSNAKTSKQIDSDRLTGCVERAQIQIATLHRLGEATTFWDGQLKKCEAALAIASVPTSPGSSPGKGLDLN